MSPLLIFLAVLPGLIISYLIFRADLYEKESKLWLVIAFALGALITYPCMKIEGLAATTGWEDSTNFFTIFFSSIVFVGLVEEFCKFICLMGAHYWRKDFNEPMDGIVYSVLIAMGFATLENVLYADRFGLQTTVLRALTAVPAHAAFAVIMGYYVGRSKFEKPRQVILILLGLMLPALVHGLYDFFILQPFYNWMMSLSTLVLILCLFVSYKFIKDLQKVSAEIQSTNNETIAVSESSVVHPIAAVSKKEPDILFDAMENKKSEEE